MFGRIRDLSGVLADYTVGTVIVMVQLARAERTNRALMP
jgi:hypothetical protein